MEYWIWLTTIRGLGPVTGKRLLSELGNPKAIYEAGKETLLTVKGIGETLSDSILSSRSLEEPFLILNECEKKNIKLLTYNDPLYPAMAKNYSGAPIILYYKGKIKENPEGVAIVGSRRCSSYGKEIVLRAAEYLARNNITVISGMAKGIDGYSHVSCLKNGGYTIAFLGSGVDICYPSEHRELMEAIIDKGAVISEYPPGTRPRAEYFPKRNALLSSWSKKVLVVEAAEKSGALITANEALKQGKVLFAPPHEIYSSTGKGTNSLLLKGANLYLDPSQLISDKSPILTKAASPVSPVETPLSKIIKANDHIPEETNNSPIEDKILRCLSETAKTLDEIGMSLQINFPDLIEYISIMELKGKIIAVAGGKYSPAEGCWVMGRNGASTGDKGGEIECGMGPFRLPYSGGY
jgi:DNA processing protein